MPDTFAGVYSTTQSFIAIGHTFAFINIEDYKAYHGILSHTCCRCTTFFSSDFVRNSLETNLSWGVYESFMAIGCRDA